MKVRSLAYVALPLFASLAFAQVVYRPEATSVSGSVNLTPAAPDQFGAGRSGVAATAQQAPAALVGSIDQIQAALAAAKGGERILLEPGSYGKLVIDSRVFAARVTLASRLPKSPAIFSAIEVKRSANLRLESLKVQFVPNLATVSFSSAVAVTSSTNIALAMMEIIGGNAVNGVPPETPTGQLDATGNILGLPAGRAITIERSANIYVEDNLVRIFSRGIILQAVNNIQVVRNTVRDLRKTPLLAGNINNALIEGNHFFNFKPWKFGGQGDHGDLIYIMTDPSQQGPSRYITIRNNWLEQGVEDALLGIYLDDNQLGIGFTNVKIENNFLYNSDFQGIRLQNVRGSVSNNTLVKPDNGTTTPGPGMSALDGSNVAVSNNVLSAVSPYRGGAVSEVNSLYVQRKNPAAAGWYGNTFFNAFKVGPVPTDFSLLSHLPKGLGADMVKLTSALGKRG